MQIPTIKFWETIRRQIHSRGWHHYRDLILVEVFPSILKILKPSVTEENKAYSEMWSSRSLKQICTIVRSKVYNSECSHILIALRVRTCIFKFASQSLGCLFQRVLHRTEGSSTPVWANHRISEGHGSLSLDLYETQQCFDGHHTKGKGKATSFLKIP